MSARHVGSIEGAAFQGAISALILSAVTRALLIVAMSAAASVRAQSTEPTEDRDGSQAAEAPAGPQAAPEDVQQRARAAFEEGSQLLAAGDVAAGTAALQRSLDLFPYLPTAYNLALARVQLGEYLQAADLLVTVLDGTYGNLSPAERRETRRTLREVDEHLGRLRVTVTGAQDLWLRLDDSEPRAITEGEAQAMRVEPGLHELEAGASEARARRVAIRVAAGELQSLRLEISGDAAQGELRVVGPDAGARVEIVGVARALGELRRPLPVGLYEVGLVGEAASRRNAIVEEGQLRTVHVDRPRGRGVAWILGGTAAAVIVGVVVAAVVLTRSGGGGGGDPVDDPIFGVIDALHRGL